MNNDTMLVIGGCRSGKSSYALELANQIPGNRKIFIATSVPTDREMENRVKKHVMERGELWITEEVPVSVPEKIALLSKDADVILVDCLTLWVSNLLFEGIEESALYQRTEELQHALRMALCPVFLVSNEVGTGIVPENQLARKFRDMAGFVNQKVAGEVARVTWMVAGIPVDIKRHA